MLTYGHGADSKRSERFISESEYSQLRAARTESAGWKERVAEMDGTKRRISFWYDCPCFHLLGLIQNQEHCYHMIDFNFKSQLGKGSTTVQPLLFCSIIFCCDIENEK